MTAGTEADPVTSVAVAEELRRYERREAVRATIRRILVFVAFVVVLGLIYTGYKAFGDTLDDAQTEWPVIGSFLPRSDDLTMPPIPAILAEFGEPPQRGNAKPLGAFVAEAALFTLREAALGFFLGVGLGIGIAVVLVRSRWLERGVSPYIAMSQTIPLIAIAPIVIIWGRTSLDWLPFECRETAVKFVEASLKGWIWCRDNPGDCVQVVLDNAPILGLSHQTWQLNEISALIWPSPLGIGIMDSELWDQTVEVATSEQILKAAPEGTAYVTDIAQEAVDNLKNQGLDVVGNDWQRVDVELVEGGN